MNYGVGALKSSRQRALPAEVLPVLLSSTFCSAIDRVRRSFQDMLETVEAGECSHVFHGGCLFSHHCPLYGNKILKTASEIIDSNVDMWMKMSGKGREFCEHSDHLFWIGFCWSKSMIIFFRSWKQNAHSSLHAMKFLSELVIGVINLDTSQCLLVDRSITGSYATWSSLLPVSVWLFPQNTVLIYLLLKWELEEDWLNPF